MTDFLGIGWHFPVQRDNSGQRLATAAYEESIRQSIRIILSTARGERVMRPEFGCGLFELVFAPNNAATRGMAAHHVEEALRTWEPRIEVLEVSANPGGEQGEMLLINIDYQVRTTDRRFNPVYPFYLARGRLVR